MPPDQPKGPDRNARKALIGADLYLYFLAVADDLSFTSSARRFGIDPSWMSHKIKELERKLGCILFVRTTRRIELTEEGRALVAPARRLAQALEDTHRVALYLQDGIAPSLTIGALPHGFWSPKRVDLIDRFIVEHPQTEVRVRNGSTPLMLKWLRSGEIDLAFVGGPFDVTGLDVVQLSEERYCVLLPKGHPLEAKTTIGFEDVAGHRMAMLSEQHSPQAVRKLFGPFLEAGAIPFAVAELEREALFRIAERNRLVVLCNVKEAPSRTGDAFVIRPMREGVTNYKYLVRRSGFATPAIETFWEMAKRVAECEPLHATG